MSTNKIQELLQYQCKLKRIYTHLYTKSISSTHPIPTIMTCFAAKRAFNKYKRDGLPGILTIFYGTWLHKRTMKIRVGETLSTSKRLESGVPEGSVLTLAAWNYNSICNYASIATLHRDIDTLMEIVQEIWQIEELTSEKRIKFKPSKSNALAIHGNPKIRRNQKSEIRRSRQK